MPPKVVEVTAEGKLQYTPVVTRHFEVTDIRESKTAAQREARVAELRAAVEKKAMSTV